jgi:carbonic anhydrase
MKADSWKDSFKLKVTPVTVSEAQVNQFEKLLGHPNNRPLQDTNAVVYQWYAIGK